jgi:acylphosphatase
MSSEPSRHAIHALVRGTVQGVGFRFFVRDHARELGLQGWVRNSPDANTVEVVAEGNRDALEALLQRLYRGPDGSHVEQVEHSWTEPQGDLFQFEIRQ